MTVLDPLGTQTLGTLMRCVVCGADVDVIEIPAPSIDPNAYVCPDHWRPFAGRPLDRKLAAVRGYDPATAPFPEGF